jgi:hypothetical protein
MQPSMLQQCQPSFLCVVEIVLSVGLGHESLAVGAGVSSPNLQSHSHGPDAPVACACYLASRNDLSRHACFALQTCAALFAVDVGRRNALGPWMRSNVDGWGPDEMHSHCVVCCVAATVAWVGRDISMSGFGWCLLGIRAYFGLLVFKAVCVEA